MTHDDAQHANALLSPMPHYPDASPLESLALAALLRDLAEIESDVSRAAGHDLPLGLPRAQIRRFGAALHAADVAVRHGAPARVVASRVEHAIDAGEMLLIELRANRAA